MCQIHRIAFKESLRHSGKQTHISLFAGMSVLWIGLWILDAAEAGFAHLLALLPV